MTYFPWPQYTQPWALRIHASLPNAPQAEIVVDEAARRIVVPSDSSWSILTLSFAVSTDEVVDIGADVIAYVLVSAARTNIRIPVKLRKEAETHVGDVTIERALLRGVADVVAQLVTDSPVRLVGVSEPWALVVEAGEAPLRKGKPPIDVQWVNFSDSESPSIAQSATDSYAVVDMTGLEPVLLLNEEVEGFKQLMMAGKPQLERRRLQTVLGSSLARLTMTSLVREAQARIIENDDDTFDPPEEPLYRAVLDALATQIGSVSDTDDLCSALGNPKSMSPTDRARLWAEIDNAVDRLTDHAESVAQVVKEVRFV
jgi:hypothetical protein